MWSGHDMESQSPWGNPPPTQSMWANGGGVNQPSMPANYGRQQQQQQWASQMAQWQQYQHTQQPPGWQQPPPMSWGSSGYGSGYDDKKMNQRGGYAYGGGYASPMGQGSSQHAWAGQRAHYQTGAPWEAPAPTANGAQWGAQAATAGQWRGAGDWQAPGGDVGGNVSQAPQSYDSWPATGDESDKYMWRDPKPKKKIRDTGTQVWGDPGSQNDKILRWKEADHEEFQRGPSSSTWNQATSAWVESTESSSWPANVWDNPEALLADDSESRTLNFAEDPQNYRENAFAGAKSSNDYNTDNNQGAAPLGDPTVFAVHAAFQRAIAKGFLPPEMKRYGPLEQRQKLMVNALLQKMIKKEQAEAELDHIRQIMARGEFPPAVAQEHDRINGDHEKLKMELSMMSEEIKMSMQSGEAWLPQWSKRGTSQDNTADLSAALQNMGISHNKFSNSGWPSDGNADWTTPPPISINTDLDRPMNLLGGDKLDSEGKKEEGPQEFVPGRKWEWHDPAKVAADPNATPGSIKISFGSPGWGNGGPDPWTVPEKKNSVEEHQEKQA